MGKLHTYKSGEIFGSDWGRSIILAVAHFILRRRPYYRGCAINARPRRTSTGSVFLKRPSFAPAAVPSLFPVADAVE